MSSITPILDIICAVITLASLSQILYSFHIWRRFASEDVVPVKVKLIRLMLKVQLIAMSLVILWIINAHIRLHS